MTNNNSTKEKEPPYIDDCYYCAACGSHSHRCDPRTGCCYECGADNLEPEPDKYLELGI